MANGFFGELIQPPSASPVPSPPAQTTAQPQVPPEQVEQNTQQWLGILNDPSVRAGLLQFGINMMQPSWDSGAAPAFRAIGAGAEAAGRQSAAQRAEQESLARQREAQTRTGIQQQELGLRERGQSLEYGLGQQRIKSDQDRLEREYQLKKELASMPPNQQETLLKMIADATNPQKAPPNLWSDPAALSQWQLEQAELANRLFRQYGIAGAPAGGAGVTPAPTSQGRIRIDAEGNVLPSEVPTQ